MSSRGPITGMNSGIKSIGLATHSPARTTAIFALRGTLGSLRSRRTVVTQSGMNAARSRKTPGGRRLANTMSRDHETSSRTTAMPIATSHSRIRILRSQWSVHRLVYHVGVRIQRLRATLEPFLGVDALRDGKDVAGLQIPRPPPQPIETMYFLAQFRHGQLADPAFLGDFDLKLVALGGERGPLLCASRVELGQQQFL